VKYFNARVTLSLRDAGGQELAVLEPEGKTDKGFGLHDGAGHALGRVVAARSDRKLLSQDRTWWVSLARPLPNRSTRWPSEQRSRSTTSSCWS
jgi:hypothetical protein